jgi:hypothetical protein
VEPATFVVEAVTLAGRTLTTYVEVVTAVVAADVGVEEELTKGGERRAHPLTSRRRNGMPCLMIKDRHFCKLELPAGFKPLRQR